MASEHVVVLVVVLASLAAGGSLVVIGGLAGYWFGSRRHKSDVVTSLCTLLNRAVNTAVVRGDDQITRTLAEEETRQAIDGANEASSPFLSPAFRGGVTRNGPPSVTMGKMP